MYGKYYKGGVKNMNKEELLVALLTILVAAVAFWAGIVVGLGVNGCPEKEPVIILDCMKVYG